MTAALNIAVVICAAGASSRMKIEGAVVKKEYQKLSNGNTVLGMAVSAFASVPSVQVIAISVPKTMKPPPVQRYPKIYYRVTNLK